MADFPFVKPEPTGTRPKALSYDGLSKSKEPVGFPMVKAKRKRQQQAPSNG